MISSENYVDIHGVLCVTYLQVAEAHSEDEIEALNEWMHGQTCLLDEETGEPAIYAWDYERWLRQGKQTEQDSDWD